MSRAATLLKAKAAKGREILEEAEQALQEEYRERYAHYKAGGEPLSPHPLPPLRTKPVRPGKKILVIGDSHAHPDQPNYRYEWLGRFVVDHLPDVIIDIGDWWDMPSLSAYDKRGSRSLEGRRYWRDVEAGVDAMERFAWQIHEFNRGLTDRYEPRLVRTLGNHEHRIERAINEEPRFENVVGTHDLLSREFGWEEHPFLDIVVIEGIAFSHYFISGVMGRPIGGENPAAMLLKKQFHSAVQGHSHMLDYCDRMDASGRQLLAMHAGCFFDFEFDWAGVQANRLYRRGLLLLENVADGKFDPCWWGLDRIKARYS